MSDTTQRTSFPKEDLQIVLFEGIHPRAHALFRADGYTNVKTFDTSLPESQLKAAVRDAHFVGIRSRTQLTAEVIDEAKRLVAIGCYCIGTNQVDLEAAEARGIPVFNAPYSNTRSVAELVIGEAILLLRRIPEKNAACHRGGWQKSAEGSYEVRDKTLGIVGYGRIGTQIGVLAESLGLHVLYYDIEAKLTLGNAKAVDDLDELLSRSDIVTVHVPETAGTRQLIDRRRIELLKPGAVFLNLSRGTVVDLEALAEALREKRLAGAAIDVFPIEPKSNKDEFVSPLRGLDNVILTPHVGGSTIEAQDNIAVEVTTKLIKYSNNGSTLTSVNLPEVSLPPHPGSHRLLHIHRNVPGMLSQVNAIFSSGRINIDAQYLQTSPHVGYVVLDVRTDEATALDARDRLAAIDGTIRTRILY
jgi:D-3-phosphoglycerate dehydrogenase / 2-oxoglutarate reductase